MPRSSWPTIPRQKELALLSHCDTTKGSLLTIHTRSNRIAGLIHQHTSIIPKLNHTPIRPLGFLAHAHDDRMPNIASPDLVRQRGGRARFGSRGSLFLYDDDYPVTWTTQSVSAQSAFEKGLEILSCPPGKGWDSPIVAGRFFFRTFTHSTTEAPELSMQFSNVCAQYVSGCRGMGLSTGAPLVESLCVLNPPGKVRVQSSITIICGRRIGCSGPGAKTE